MIIANLLLLLFTDIPAIHNQAAYKKTNDNENTTNKQVDKKKGKAKGKENVQVYL